MTNRKDIPDTNSPSLFAIYLVTEGSQSGSMVNGQEAENPDEVEHVEEKICFHVNLLHSNAEADIASAYAAKLKREMSHTTYAVPRYSVVQRLRVGSTSEPGDASSSARTNEGLTSISVYSISFPYSVPKQTLHLALFHWDQEIFEHFEPDIDKFCLSVEPQLKLVPEWNDSVRDNLTEILSSWYAKAIFSLLDAINLLRPVLPFFLFAALSGETIVIDCKDPSIRANVDRLFDLCSVNSLSNSGSNANSSKATSPDIGETPQVTDAADARNPSSDGESRLFYLTIETEPTMAIRVLEEKTNNFAEKWSEVLLKSADAGLCASARHLIVAFKLKVVQDLNMLKRLLVAAENDHYALFRALEFLKKSQNDKLLMKLARQECDAATRNQEKTNAAQSEHMKLLNLLAESLYN